jgi:hypothetical protein
MLFAYTIYFIELELLKKIIKKTSTVIIFKAQFSTTAYQCHFLFSQQSSFSASRWGEVHQQLGTNLKTERHQLLQMRAE